MHALDSLHSLLGVPDNLTVDLMPKNIDNIITIGLGLTDHSDAPACTLAIKLEGVGVYQLDLSPEYVPLDHSYESVFMLQQDELFAGDYDISITGTNYIGSNNQLYRDTLYLEGISNMYVILVIVFSYGYSVQVQHHWMYILIQINLLLLKGKCSLLPAQLMMILMEQWYILNLMYLLMGKATLLSIKGIMSCIHVVVSWIDQSYCIAGNVSEKIICEFAIEKKNRKIKIRKEKINCLIHANI